MVRGTSPKNRYVRCVAQKPVWCVAPVPQTPTSKIQRITSVYDSARHVPRLQTPYPNPFRKEGAKNRQRRLCPCRQGVISARRRGLVGDLEFRVQNLLCTYICKIYITWYAVSNYLLSRSMCTDRCACVHRLLMYVGSASAI